VPTGATSCDATTLAPMASTVDQVSLGAWKFDILQLSTISLLFVQALRAPGAQKLRRLRWLEYELSRLVALES